MKYIFAGDRDIAVEVLKFLIQDGCFPEALMVPDDDRSSHAEELIRLSKLPANKVFKGTEFASPDGLKVLASLKPDYIFGIHFPYLISSAVLQVPEIGFLNLHPAYLPYNRGWHTPTWAILEGTPIGATLHFMAEELDAGDIIHQKTIEVKKEYTANQLYNRLKALELEVFKEAWPEIKSLNPNRTAQNLSDGTAHKKKDLFHDEVQKLDLEQDYNLDVLLTKLRALTTSDINEAAYFNHKGSRYRLQVIIKKEST